MALAALSSPAAHAKDTGSTIAQPPAAASAAEHLSYPKIDLNLDAEVAKVMQELDPNSLHYVVDMEKILRKHIEIDYRAMKAKRFPADSVLYKPFSLRVGATEGIIAEITDKLAREYNLPQGNKETFGTVEYYKQFVRQLLNTPETELNLITNKDGKRVKVLFLQRAAQDNELNDALITGSGFVDDAIHKKLFAKYRFTDDQTRAYRAFHEVGHIFNSSAGQDVNPDSLASIMLFKHKAEMLADTFTTLFNLKRSWDPAPIQAISDLRRVKAFNGATDSFKHRGGEIWYGHGYYMTSKGIDAALDWAAQHREELGKMTVSQIHKKAVEITEREHYSSAQLQGISKDLIQAAAKLRWYAKGKFPASALRRPLTSVELESYRQELFTDQLASPSDLLKAGPPNPVKEEDRFARTIELGLLPADRPWVKSLKQAYERVMDVKIAEPALRGLTHNR